MAKKSIKNDKIQTIKEEISMNNDYTMNTYPNNTAVSMNTGYEVPNMMGQVYYDSGRMINPTTSLSMRLDVAELLRIQAQSMFEAYYLGARSTSLAIPQQSNAEMFGVDVYLGVYDDEAYGVYNNVEKYNKSEIFWHVGSQCKQTFATYDEALDFARNGVASFNHIDVKDVPPLKTACNWRQKITDV